MIAEAEASEADRARMQEDRRRQAESLRDEKSRAATRERCKSLAGFVREAWAVLEPVAPYVHGWHIDAVAEHLEAVSDGRINRLLINIPPGHSKSLLVSVFWPAWEWAMGKRSLRYLATAFASDATTRDTRKMRDLIMSDWFQALWPDLKLIRKGDEAISNTSTGVREGSPFGSLTSRRGDRLICLPYDQRLLTDRGWLKIGRIVDGKLPVRIAAFDGAAVHWREIEAFETNPTGPIFEITAGTNTVRCTGDHPVFIVGRGWIRADAVQNGEATLSISNYDAVRELPEAGRASGQQGSEVLLSGLLRGGEEAPRPGGQYAPLRNMRQARVSSSSASEAEGELRIPLLTYLRKAIWGKEPSLSWRKGREGLRALWKGILGEQERIAASDMLFWFLRIHKPVECVWSAPQAKSMPSVSKGISAWPREDRILRSQVRECSARASDGWRRKRAIRPWRSRATVSSGVDENAQSINQETGWQRLSRMFSALAGRREEPSCAPYRLCEREPEREQSDHGLRVLPWDDAWAAKPACGVAEAVISNIERLPCDGKPTYNVRVATDHCYFAEGILLHNCDDIHSVKTAESEAQREDTVRLFREGAVNRLNSQEHSAIVVIMQRLHERDVAGVILSLKMGYVHLNLPLEFEPDRRCQTKIGFKDPRTRRGEVIDPVRFPPDVVAQLKSDMGSHAYAGQYQQRPAPREGGMFKRRDFVIVDAVPSEARRRVRRWDLAASIVKGGYDPDWTVGLKMSTDGRKFYVEHVERFRETGASVRRAIKNIAAADGRACEIVIPQDPGQAGKDQAESIIAENAGYVIKAERETGAKDIRAEPMAAQVEAGNVCIVRADWNQDFLDELCNFPSAAHDDQFDAAAGAFNALAGIQGPMRISVDELKKVAMAGRRRMR